MSKTLLAFAFSLLIATAPFTQTGAQTKSVEIMRQVNVSVENAGATGPDKAAGGGAPMPMPADR